MTTGNISRFWEWGKKIICVGRNYADHAKELMNAVPKYPVLFLKTPSSYLTEGSPILIPKYSNNLHHEVELGVVIGKRGTSISQSSAMDHVAGYALCLDMTARDVQDDCKSKGLPWTLAKAFDTSCPVSEFIPKERIPDHGNVKIWLKVNDQMRQYGCTSEMIFSIPFLISYISEIITLEEGDLILTGTPKGVSAVQVHDELNAGIDDVVSMTFKVDRLKEILLIHQTPCDIKVLQLSLYPFLPSTSALQLSDSLLMGPQPWPSGSSSTMKMLFLQNFQRPKWTASQVVLSLLNTGLRTVQWSVTTAASMQEIPIRMTKNVIFTLLNVYIVNSSKGPDATTFFVAGELTCEPSEECMLECDILHSPECVRSPGVFLGRVWVSSVLPLVALHTYAREYSQ
ncbi:hypothetical protein DPEC_G00307420 [Dallia pectoralis]|uniref:Uncharacterized protein n=1 Tax=Dallia pectoralis TaxID=75939 RepID=A0ACC2FEJ6_DALPE|nr:hypothetical protein DPEC_G00307420 [Dallia pectoralis]